ncbi:hypothetical protein CANTEDRAFT_134056 [Yamadazyma tenuis ATCC 10573]|nr:uncharacterized protein CANTEDRAFT_134056 [Yamadazyma tenuis ATCC 10573]EGV64744.1 hypothetical protein CANTEDRAFT_134056 [Yamadazyma tenuis ATCC 10573]
MKSAMKNSSSFSVPNNSRRKSNAAHEAYLSLTTAENTRLNSKMSLNDINPVYSQSHHYPTDTASATPLNKRMSTSLRKPPPQAQGGPGSSPGMVKSLRPQSMQIDPSRQANENASPGARMSHRSLRDRSSVYVQPIAPHPALNPNYQSSSQVKAAELYAKANSRPHSTFNAPRKTSFSNEHASPGDSAMRTSLRDHLHQSPPPDYQQHQPRQTNQLKPPQFQGQGEPITPTKPRSSRFVDSDDEISHNGVLSPESPGVFSTRYINSEQEKYSHTVPHSQPQIKTSRQPQIMTLREPPKSKVPDHGSGDKRGKEKKKVGGRLRKLFGRS